MIIPVTPQQNENSPSSQPESETGDGERRRHERRKRASEGYLYISTVGWICRRERARRKEDDLDEVD